MSSKKPKISICLLIPVLNEIQNIEELISRLAKCLFHQNYLLVFIDDGSTDGTIEQINIEQVNNKRVVLLQREKKLSGCQRGGALLHGLKGINNIYDIDIWCEMDGDLSHQPEEINPALIEMNNKATDVLIISKYLNGSITIGRSFARRFISFVNSYLFRSTFSSSITDYSNGFRFYNDKAANCVLNSPIKYSTPIYLGEVLIYWLKNEMIIKEIAGKYIGRAKGKSEVSIKDIFEGLIGYLYLIKLLYVKKKS